VGPWAWDVGTTAKKHTLWVWSQRTTQRTRFLRCFNNFKIQTHFKFYVGLNKILTYILKSQQHLCVIHLQEFEIIACTGGAKVVQIFAPVCTRMCKTVRSRYLMQNNSFFNDSFFILFCGREFKLFKKIVVKFAWEYH